MQSPAPGPVRVLLERRARLAAPLLVGDDVAVLVEERRLEARPGAHVGAHLLARPAGEQVGRRGEQAEEEVLGEGGVAGQDRPGHGRRVVEVHDPGAAGERGDEQPGRVLRHLLEDLLARDSGALVQTDPRAAVALDPALDPHEQIGPHGLRAGEAAPHAARDAGREEQTERAEQQQSGQVVDFLRPDLDPQEVRAAGRHVDQERLIRHARAAVPADPGAEVVDAEQQDQHRPLDRAEAAADLLGIDLDPIGIERVPLQLLEGAGVLDRDGGVVHRAAVSGHPPRRLTGRRPGSGRRRPGS